MAMALSSTFLRNALARQSLRSGYLATTACRTLSTTSGSRFASSNASAAAATPATQCVDIARMKPSERAAMEEDLDGVYVLPHMKAAVDASCWRLPHPVWTSEEMDAVKFQHLPPRSLLDWTAYTSVMTLRRVYDFITGYSLVRQDENAMLRRVIFLETIAGVPGMVGAAIRHMRSLRTMERDYGWIHTLLEEAENERMHLMTAMLLRDASLMVKGAVMAAQGVFVPLYTLLYAVSPKFCHRFVGYLEEQAVKTYTDIVNKVDSGDLPGFTEEAPDAMRKYWKLPEGATLRDVFLAMRADEDHHREVNHTFAEVKALATNPFPPGF